MRIALVCIFLILYTIPTLTQTSDWDELPLPVLRQKLAASREDTTKVQLQLAIGHLMFFKPTRGAKDVDSAVRFAAEADELSRRLNYHFGILNAMLLSVESYYSRGEREIGLKIARGALAYAQRDHDSDGEARSYHLIAKYYLTLDPAALQKRILYANKAITIFRKNRNNHWLSTLLTDNADMWFQSDRITKGLGYCSRH